jgi:hypothetical protein
MWCWSSRRDALVVWGIAVGVVTLVGQEHLSTDWNPLANSVAVWLLAAFIAGAVAPSDRWAAAAGTVTLLCALLGYYVAAATVVNAPSTAYSTAIWVAGAVIGGPIFGAAGNWWRDDARLPHVRETVPAWR